MLVLIGCTKEDANYSRLSAFKIAIDKVSTDNSLDNESYKRMNNLFVKYKDLLARYDRLTHTQKKLFKDQSNYLKDVLFKRLLAILNGIENKTDDPQEIRAIVAVKRKLKLDHDNFDYVLTVISPQEEMNVRAVLKLLNACLQKKEPIKV